ncbi:MAG: hypothetical protein ACI395_08735 [Candidatus Cryptobacteroides sp.]
MKIDTVKTIIAFAVSALLGLLCFKAAPVTESRQWISLGVSALSMFLTFAPAIAVDYSKAGRRATSAKVTGWLFFIAVFAANLIFSFTDYDVVIYIICVGLLTVIGDSIIYAIARS